MAEQTPATTIIGADARFVGELSFENNARILGNFEGRIQSKGELTIAEGATAKATIEVARLQLEGNVDGDITAKDRLELTNKARVKGNIIAARLAVAEGATIVGHVTIGGDAPAAKAETEASSFETKPMGDRTVINTYGRNGTDFRAATAQPAAARR
jgi:cytoskeletal protein CcmA (bactofilin family)